MFSSKLFKNISEKRYARYYNRLKELRKQYPGYRDDELLMYMLCTQKENKR